MVERIRLLGLREASKLTHIFAHKSFLQQTAEQAIRYSTVHIIVILIMKLTALVFSSVMGSTAAFSSFVSQNRASTAVRSTTETIIPGTVDDAVVKSSEPTSSTTVVDGAVATAGRIESGMDVDMPMETEILTKTRGIQRYVSSLAGLFCRSLTSSPSTW